MRPPKDAAGAVFGARRSFVSFLVRDPRWLANQFKQRQKLGNTSLLMTLYMRKACSGRNTKWKMLGNAIDVYIRFTVHSVESDRRFITHDSLNTQNNHFRLLLI